MKLRIRTTQSNEAPCEIVCEIPADGQPLAVDVNMWQEAGEVHTRVRIEYMKVVLER